MASTISLVRMGIDFGRPVTWSRPRTSMDSSSSSGRALPIWIFTSSAVASPIISPYLRRM